MHWGYRVFFFGYFLLSIGRYISVKQQKVYYNTTYLCLFERKINCMKVKHKQCYFRTFGKPFQVQIRRWIRNFLIKISKNATFCQLANSIAVLVWITWDSRTILLLALLTKIAHTPEIRPFWNLPLEMSKNELFHSYWKI